MERVTLWPINAIFSCNKMLESDDFVSGRIGLKPNTHRRRRRDETVASRRRCEHTRRQSWPTLQFPALTTDKWRHNDVIVEKNVKIHEYYTTQQIRMFTNMQRICYVIVLLCHWLQNCKLGHGRRLRCAFASPNPSAVVANSCTHHRRRRDKTVSSRRRRRCVLGLTAY